MPQEDGHFLANLNQGFNAIRGVGQGDCSGPLCWIAVFDVLLCWTDTGDPVIHPETLPELETTTEPENPDREYGPIPSATDNRVAYADDLADCVYSIDAQRRQALWVSAFCVATGLEIAVTTINTVVLNGPSSLPGDSLETMTTFNSQWQPTAIDIQTTTAVIKYLGVEISMDGHYGTAFSWAENRLRQALQALRLRKADKESKMQVVRFSILPKILYRASKAFPEDSLAIWI
jgi:hypothetical protein